MWTCSCSPDKYQRPVTVRVRVVRLALLVSTINCLNIARKDTTLRDMRQEDFGNSFNPISLFRAHPLLLVRRRLVLRPARAVLPRSANEPVHLLRTDRAPGGHSRPRRPR